MPCEQRGVVRGKGRMGGGTEWLLCHRPQLSVTDMRICSSQDSCGFSLCMKRAFVHGTHYYCILSICFQSTVIIRARVLDNVTVATTYPGASASQEIFR